MKYLIILLGIAIAFLGLELAAWRAENTNLREAVEIEISKEWRKEREAYNARDLSRFAHCQVENDNLRSLHKNLNLDHCMCEVKHE